MVRFGSDLAHFYERQNLDDDDHSKQEEQHPFQASDPYGRNLQNLQARDVECLPKPKKKSSSLGFPNEQISKAGQVIHSRKQNRALQRK